MIFRKGEVREPVIQKVSKTVSNVHRWIPLTGRLSCNVNRQVKC